MERVYANLDFLQHNPKIVVSRDGGSLRRILNGRHVKAVDFYPSFKAGMAIAAEADHEVGLIYHSDCDQAVVKCLTQPHRLVIPVRFQSRPLIYFPDMQRELADGTIEIIETKREDDRRLNDPHYQLKLAAAKLIYQRKNWKFRTLMREEILFGRLAENVKQIASCAYVKVDSAAPFVLENEISKAGGSIALARAVEITRSIQRVNALIVRRVLSMRLDLSIDAESAVSLVDHEALRRSSPPML